MTDAGGSGAQFVTAFAMAVIVAACGTQAALPRTSDATSSGPPPSLAMPSRTPERSPESPSSSATAPQPADGSSWVPLAVYRPDAGTMDALEHGELVLTDTCVFVDSVSGQRHLVVWPLMPEKWTWDAERRELVSTWTGQTRRFGSGDQVRLGGGGRTGGYGLSIEEIIAATPWISPPAPGCVTQRVFFSNGEISEP